MKNVRLFDLAHARSGDKGDTVNVGVIARDMKDYDLIRKVLTVEKVKEHFGDMVKAKSSASSCQTWAQSIFTCTKRWTVVAPCRS